MTMKEIAEKAGVSTATVSYVLNKTGNVSEKMREKILQIIDEEGYTPNRMAKGLRSNKTDTVGVLVEDITSFQTPRIINGITSYMEQRGYHILLSDLGLIKKTGSVIENIPKHQKDIEDAANLLYNSQVDGIIYIAMHDRDIGGLLNQMNVPLVYAYCYDENDEELCVTYDNKAISYEVTQYLIENNHSKIGIIWGKGDSKPAQLRFEGFAECMEKNGLAVNTDFIYKGDWEFESGQNAYENYKKSAVRPTAVFAMNDLMAIGFMDAALEDGLKVPEEVSVIGFDHRESCIFCRPRLTTVDLPLEKMGYEAGRMITRLVRGKKLTDREIMLPCKLIRKQSVLI